MLWFAVVAISTLSTLYSVCLKIIQKAYIRKKADFFIFSFYMNLIQSSVLLALPPYSGWVFSRDSFVYGAIIGLLILANYLFTVLAISKGPLALTNSIFSLNMLVPILYGLYFWEETLSVTAIAGLLLFLFSIVLVSNATYFEKETKKKTDLKWLLYVLLSFACSGITMIISKHFALIRPTETRSYLLVYMWTNIILSAGAYLVLRRQHQAGAAPFVAKRLFRRKYLLLCLAAGTAMAGANLLFMRSIGISSSAFFFPATRGLGIIMMLVISSVLFKERLSKRALSGFVLSALAILMLSFN